MQGEQTAAEIRTAVEALGERGRGYKYPKQIREQVQAFVTERRGMGVSWDEISAEVGVNPATLVRWCDGNGGGVEKTPAAFKAVSVRDDAAYSATDGLVLVSPLGYRVEGLGVESVVAVMRALG